MAEKTFLKRLQRFFGIKVASNSMNTGQRPVPAKYNAETNRTTPVKFPSDIQKYYDYWVTNYDNYESLKNRFDRYRDLEFCVLNSGIVGFAHELYTDESIAADENGEIIQVNAKNKKVEKYIREFYERIGIDRTVLRSVSSDIALYADHFWALSVGEEVGIEEITPVSPYTVQDRLEFNAIRMASIMTQNKTAFMKASARDSRMKSMIDAINGVSVNKDYSSWFRTYLFGFQLDNGEILPPWNMIHFRRYDTNSEFAPFGKPLFLKSIARFRQLKALENLLAMLRAAKFPREVFNVQLDENMPETERWMKLNEIRDEYYSFGNLNSGDENDLDVAAPVWTADGLVSFDMKESRVQLDDLGDLESIRDDLAVSTAVPQAYYAPNRGSFGESGQALLQQYKPFGRKVFQNQSAILEGLVNLVKMQFAITGDFDIDEDFEITMTFPVIEETRDRISTKNDTLRLATDVIDNIGQAVGLDRDATLPRDVVKDVFQKLSFLSRDDVDQWIDAIPTADDGDGEDGAGGGWYDSLSDTEKTKMKEKHKRMRSRVKTLTEETVRTAYFKAKRDSRITEGVQSSRHFMTSHSVPSYYKRVFEFAAKSPQGKLDEQIDLDISTKD